MTLEIVICTLQRLKFMLPSISTNENERNSAEEIESIRLGQAELKGKKVNRLKIFKKKKKSL